MGSTTDTLDLVGHDRKVAARAEVVASLFGLETRRFLSAEGALEALASNPPRILLTDLWLPGADGVSLIATATRRAPGLHAFLLSRVAPAFAPTTPRRIGLTGALSLSNGWAPLLCEHLAASRTLREGGGASILKDAILGDGEGFDALAAALSADQLSDGVELLALRWLAATFDLDRVLAVLERVIAEDSRRALPASQIAAVGAMRGDSASAMDEMSADGSLGADAAGAIGTDRAGASGPSFGSSPVHHPELHRVALELAMELGAAGFDVVAAIAESGASSARLRGVALRHLAEAFPHDAVSAVLWRAHSDPDSRVRSDAAGALLASALNAESGASTLASLAEGEGAPEDVRRRAIGHLARTLPRSQTSALFARLSGSSIASIAAAAATQLAKADGFDADQWRDVVESERASDAERLAVMARVARELPQEQALPILERAQLSASPAVRARAFELAIARAPIAFEGTVDRAAHASVAEQRAVLLGVLGAGKAGRGALERLAEAPGVELEVRCAALRLMGLRFGAPDAIPLLERALRSQEVELAEEAARALAPLGAPGWAALRSCLASDAQVGVRIAALHLLEAHSDDELFRSSLSRATRDDDLDVRCTAVELAVRRAGAAAAPLLAKVVELGDPELQNAALEGAIGLSDAGFGVVAAIGSDDGMAPSVRARALAHLRDAFLYEEAGPVLAAAAARGFGADRIARGGRAVAEAWEVADTRPSPPARAQVDSHSDAREATRPSEDSAPIGDELDARGEPDDAQPSPRSNAPAPSDGATPRAGAMPPVQGPERSREVVVTGVPPEEIPTVPAAPADEVGAQTWLPTGWRPPTALASEPTPWGHSRPTNMPPVDLPPSLADAVHQSGPARPAKRRRSRAIDLPRAREALQAALRLGRDGYRGMRTLADSERVPDEVRVMAIRHLAADFPDRPIGDVLDRAMASPEPELHSAALSAAMLRRDASVDRIRALAKSAPGAGTRIRALRFLASRFDKTEVRGVLEALLFDPSSLVRRAALESLFTSLRFAPEGGEEQALVNLLREHEQLEVKISAAKALGAFGSQFSIRALEDFTGLFGMSEVKDAARDAIARIRARDR